MTRLLLLVDDDIDDQELFLDALAIVNGQIKSLIANDGLEALNLLQQTTVELPQVIFLDVNMPRMDGIKFLQAINGLDKIQEIPIFVYSTSSQAAEEAKRLGARDFLVKPDNFEGLCALISDALERVGNR